MKKCSQCDQEKPESEYYFKYPGKLHAHCKKCHSKYTARHYLDNSPDYKSKAQDRKLQGRELILEAKNKPCMDCGRTFDPVCMDFDHLRDKKYNLAEMASRRISLERIKEEIQKCEVVCACCHRLRTKNRNAGIAQW